VAIEIRLPFDEAKASCEEHSATLATVTSSQEQDFLMRFLFQ